MKDYTKENYLAKWQKSRQQRKSHRELSLSFTGTELIAAVAIGYVLGYLPYL